MLRLHLKLLADVGLVGYPNAGKSTLISRISAAKPKIADYPFTTLTPNLGVVTLSDNRSFVVADVPGLIEGAHEGHGLGDRFLKHLERTKVLIHLVDVSGTSGRDPVADLDVLRRELALFSQDLASKPQLVAATKMDAVTDDAEQVARARTRARELELPFFRISGGTGDGSRCAGRSGVAAHLAARVITTNRDAIRLEHPDLNPEPRLLHCPLPLPAILTRANVASTTHRPARGHLRSDSISVIWRCATAARRALPSTKSDRPLERAAAPAAPGASSTTASRWPRSRHRRSRLVARRHRDALDPGRSFTAVTLGRSHAPGLHRLRKFSSSPAPMRSQKLPRGATTLTCWMPRTSS